MKGHKLLFCAVAAFIAVAVAATAIVMFRDELTSFLANIGQKLDEKRKTVFSSCDCGDDYKDYADV